jgi:tRNA-2-methylthio-N6-dimethylallyladenosine synthase
MPMALRLRGDMPTSDMQKRYHVTTFGCQMNEHDSERMKGMLESLGYVEAGSADGADLILFNTCSIREKADERFIAHLNQAAALKRRDPERVIGVGGCWAQSVKEQVFRQFPFVDVAFGPGQVHKLAEFLTSDSITAQGFFEFEGFTGQLPMRRARDFQAWMQISVGCNLKCSYCIVPSTRGREVSRPFAELVAEAERLVGEGVREITLLGQNVNSYGRDLRPDRRSFSELLRAVDATGIARVRYTSPHPKDIREDVIAAHAELPSLCEQIHLPLQSGSTPILKAMRRTYTKERFLDRVALIREHVPDVALTTDVIVGFPGETEEDFAHTLDVMEQVGFDGAFTFVYSPRRGTEAAEMADRFVDHEVAVARMERLVEVVQRRARERAQRFVGRTMEVLVEGTSRNDPTKLRGRTRHGKVVNFTGLAAPGELVQVEITAATSQTLAGEESLLARAGG